MDANRAVYLMLIGAPNSAFHVAAAMAQAAGAHVVLADGTAQAIELLREACGDVVMIDIDQDIAGFIAQLRAERIAIPVLACGIDASADRAVAAIRAGARDYVPLPPQADLIAAAILSVAECGTRMIGTDAAFARTTALALAIAPSSAPLLIAGPPGAGKEILARAVHGASGRRGRFLVVDCAGGNEALLGSELFGHPAGAFAGAVARRCGRIDEASSGTVLLRDVDTLALPLQKRLLTVLQDHALARDRLAHARIVASTAADLDTLAARGAFNASLLTRLGLVRIAVPALRERRDDIIPLADHFAERFALANELPVPAFDSAAQAQLQDHDWPGNVRELEDCVHRAVLLSRSATIPESALVTADGRSLSRAMPSDAPFVAQTVDDVERDLILRTLQHCRGNRTTASTILGISVRTMRNKLKTFIEAGIEVAPGAAQGRAA
ncbi:MAG: sigma-54-dependent transcriptional regulator [Sphingomonadaceae bacterium]